MFNKKKIKELENRIEDLVKELVKVSSELSILTEACIMVNSDVWKYIYAKRKIGLCNDKLDELIKDNNRSEVYRIINNHYKGVKEEHIRTIDKLYDKYEKINNEL
jgi:archaellum component FlaC